MYQQQLGADPVDWTAVINNAIATAGQIIQPGSYSSVPVYQPGSTTYMPGVGGIPSWIIPVGAVLAVVLLMRGRR